MKTYQGTHRTYLWFLPFLLIYIILVLAFPSNGTAGDESRYIQYAKNILVGYYSIPGPSVDLSNGPGYPILIMPFVALGFPLVTITLLNALFHYLSIVLIYYIVRKYSSHKLALSFSIFWGLYFNAYQYMNLILSETLTYFLISIILYIMLNIDTTNSHRKQLASNILAGLTFGFLILTKVIFFYVWLALLFICVIYYFLTKIKYELRRFLVILGVAFLLILPYLTYTYLKTGRLFYVSTKSDNLYWMSTPYENEYGDWFENLSLEASSDPMSDQLFDKTQIKKPKLVTLVDTSRGRNPLLINHSPDLVIFDSLYGVQQDDAFKKAAIANIKAHPKKYAENIFSNMGRMLFSFPFSYTLQKPRTLFRLPMNGILAVLALFCLIPTFLNWRRIPLPIQFMLLFTTFYLQLSLLLSAETRMFTVIVPVLIVWIAYILNKTVTISSRFRSLDT